MNISICVSVVFFSGKRKSPPCLCNERYFPHLVVKDDEDYLGVCFIAGSDCKFDEPVDAVVLPIYEGVQYSKLKIDTPFFVMEGSTRVGEGIVTGIHPHAAFKDIKNYSNRY